MVISHGAQVPKLCFHPEFLGVFSIASEIQHGMVGRSFGPGQDVSFLIAALPLLLWASEGTSLSLKCLVCKAGMVLISPTWGSCEEKT